MKMPKHKVWRRDSWRETKSRMIWRPEALEQGNKEIHVRNELQDRVRNKIIQKSGKTINKGWRKGEAKEKTRRAGGR